MKPIHLLILVLVCVPLHGYCQEDSLSVSAPGMYNAFRVGIGLERSPYLELGFSRIGISDKDWAGSFGYYVAGQLNISNQPNGSKYLYGGKAGFETAWVLGMWGVEIKYLTNQSEQQFYFTPKVGLSALGFLSILYGYNTPAKDKLKEISSHQVSITLNWSRKLFDYLK